MNAIVDTHALIWFLEDHSKLSDKAFDIISDLQNNVYVSLASIWELSIKLQLKKLKFDYSLQNLVEEKLPQNNFLLLYILPKHIYPLTDLELIHRDPFDRLIAMQSITTKMPVITIDEHISRYGATIIW